MNIKDNDTSRNSKLFYVILALLIVGVPLGLWKIVSMYNYNSKQEIVDTFLKGAVERDRYDFVTVKAWHYVTGAETDISTGYGGHSIAFITAAAGRDKFQGKFYLGIFSVDSRIFYGDKSVLSRGVNCDDATEISIQELEDLIVLGRQAPVIKRVIKRDHCQMSGMIEDDTDVSGNIRQGARLAYHDQ
jgi:hypothetical protein